MSRRRRSRGSGAPNPEVFFAVLNQILATLGSLQGKLVNYKGIKAEGINVPDAVSDFQDLVLELVNGIRKSVKKYPLPGQHISPYLDVGLV